MRQNMNKICINDRLIVKLSLSLNLSLSLRDRDRADTIITKALRSTYFGKRSNYNIFDFNNPDISAVYD